MDFYNPYLAVALYPLLAYFLGDPAVFKWGLAHGAEPMPVALDLRAQRIGRLLWILRYAILSAYVLYGLRLIAVQKNRAPIQAAIVGIIVGLRSFRYDSWPSSSGQISVSRMRRTPRCWGQLALGSLSLHSVDLLRNCGALFVWSRFGATVAAWKPQSSEYPWYSHSPNWLDDRAEFRRSARKCSSPC
jgi:hypothetical protein